MFLKSISQNIKEENLEGVSFTLKILYISFMYYLYFSIFFDNKVLS